MQRKQKVFHKKRREWDDKGNQVDNEQVSRIKVAREGPELNKRTQEESGIPKWQSTL
jgi:hypothetical protein